MAFEFSADEIFRMAIQIEENGAGFYREAARDQACAPVKNLLLDIAAMEEDHARTFAGMKKDLSPKDRESSLFDPEGEAALYLRSLADSRVFSPPLRDQSPFPALKGACGEDALSGILEFALEREKDSIIFYLGMKELLAGESGKCQIDEIIREEMQHVRILGNQLAQKREEKT